MFLKAGDKVVTSSQRVGGRVHIVSIDLACSIVVREQIELNKVGHLS